jgi:hypothetical protein
MAVDCEHKAMPHDELEWWVNYAKTLPSYHDAQCIELALYKRLFGLATPTEKELIDSISSFYTKSFYEKVFSDVKADLEKSLENALGLPAINVIDDQVAEAVMRIQDDLNSKRDYFSIYRILVDCCGWPSRLTDFCLKFSRLDFPGTLTYQVEYNQEEPSNSPLYQAINADQKEHKDWPVTFYKWKTYKTNDKTFVQRRELATKFLKILKDIEKNSTIDILS